MIKSLSPYLLCISLAVAPMAAAQELNCQVTVNADQISGTKKPVF